MPLIKKNIALICNPMAGSGLAVLMAQRIEKYLHENNFTFSVFTDNWPLKFEGFTDIFISGGDGTLNYFINKYPAINLPLAIFKGGTGNDFHWLLYADKTFEEQLQTVLTETPKPIDIGKCNERYFINGVGIGYEGEVAKALTGKKKRPGKTSFLITVLKKIFTYRSRNYEINSGEYNYSGKKLLVDISNGKRAGGGFYIAPEARADDGLLDVIVADALNPFQRLLYLPVIEKGKHLRLPFIHHFCTKKITVKSNLVLQFHLDGEYFEAKKVEIEILTSRLRFCY